MVGRDDTNDRSAASSGRRIGDRLRDAWRSLDLRNASPIGIAMGVLVVAGLVLRVRGYVFGLRPLWWDEASWAVHLVEPPLSGDYLRPIGFMKVIGALAVLFGPSERVLRALPWLAGMTTVVLSPFLATRLFTNGAARVLFVAILALHPAAIDLSKEFKPYSISLALHTGLLLATLRYVATARGKDLATALVIAVIGPLFAQDMTFAYPGTFLVLLGVARARGRAHVGSVLLSAGLIVAFLGACYLLIWRRIDSNEVSYWTDKYDVFYGDSSHASYLAWFGEKYRELRELPGDRRELWESSFFSPPVLDGLKSIDGVLWSLLHFTGLFGIAVGRRAREALLVVLPLVMLAIFSALHFWPMGAFRTNLFTLLYLSVLAGRALDWPFRAFQNRFVPAAAAALVLVPLVLFESDWHASKRADSNDGNLQEALARLYALRAGEARPKPEPLFLGSSACAEWGYYSRVHPGAEEMRRQVERSFTPTCVAAREVSLSALRVVNTGSRAWVILYFKPRLIRIAANNPGLELVHNELVGLLRVAVFQKASHGAPADSSPSSDRTRKRAERR